MSFFTSEVFKLGSFSVTGWMLVAAIAVVVLLVVIIAVAASAGKKKKKAASKEANANAQVANANNEQKEDAKPIAEENIDAKEEAPTSVVEETKPAEEEIAPVAEDTAVEEEPAPVSEPIVKAVKRDEPKVEEEKPVEEPKATSAPIVKAVKREEDEVKAEEIAVASEEKDEKKLSPRKQGLVEINMNKTVKETKKQTKKTEVTKVAKPTVKAATPSKDSKTSQKIIVISGDAKDTFGKYYIIPSNSAVRPYKFCLKANNGQLMFESEPYKAKPKLASINAFKKHCANGIFEVDEDKAGSFRYKLYSKDGTLIGVGESYSTKVACEKSVESVKKFADSATVIEDTTIEE